MKNPFKSWAKENHKHFSSFDRDTRIDTFKLDDVTENILDTMNQKLRGTDKAIQKFLTGKPYPSLIITGVPRSGTTLLSQLLPARYDLGYVSNLMARFYMSPVTGAWLQQKLMPTEIHSLRNFSSLHGETKHIYEPHEFGYFWSYYLNTGSDCHEPENRKQLRRMDFPGLNKILAHISTVFSRPTVYKCTIAPFILNNFFFRTNIFCLHINRNKKQTIESILAVRKQRLGDPRKWWSLRPIGWEKMMSKSPYEQVEWQYTKTLEAIRKNSKDYPHRYHEITLEEFIKSPETVLEKAITAYQKHANVPIQKVGTSLEPLG